MKADNVVVLTKRPQAAAEPERFTPRDALVEMLRKIDEGEVNPFALVICHSYIDEFHQMQVGYENACADGLMAVGLVSQVKNRMMNSG